MVTKNVVKGLGLGCGLFVVVAVVFARVSPQLGVFLVCFCCCFVLPYDDDEWFAIVGSLHDESRSFSLGTGVCFIQLGRSEKAPGLIMSSVKTCHRFNQRTNRILTDRKLVAQNKIMPKAFSCGENCLK